jgi:hypothetical protein
LPIIAAQKVWPHWVHRMVVYLTATCHRATQLTRTKI